ncbi:ATP-binding cassette domain-containing protein [Candidatus Dependentiae bacterium]|nr:ATP-binding cassette domain-containing protein [Candidatus Dependentiae bacterium]
MLTLHNVTFRFSPTAVDFFHQVNLTIDRPGITFVTGKNGVGKTTLFNILLSQLAPHAAISGTITTATASYHLNKPQERERFAQQIALVHQHVTQMLADEFTGLRNLQFSSLRKKPGLQPLPDVTPLIAIAQRFGIPLNRAVHNLSGGQRQLLAIIMALHHQVDLLLLDEPTAALDDVNSDLVLSLVAELAHERKIPVLCISHEPALVKKFSNGLTIVIEQQEQGRIIREVRT